MAVTRVFSTDNGEMRNTTPSSTAIGQKDGIALVKRGSSVVTYMQTLAGLSAGPSYSRDVRMTELKNSRHESPSHMDPEAKPTPGYLNCWALERKKTMVMI